MTILGFQVWLDDKWVNFHPADVRIVVDTPSNMDACEAVASSSSLPYCSSSYGPRSPSGPKPSTTQKDEPPK